ncbi:MAG: glycoside hydrolase family 30 beta sandwich domain-containing protein [Prolixibacteraceae bacterium]
MKTNFLKNLNPKSSDLTYLNQLLFAILLIILAVGNNNIVSANSKTNSEMKENSAKTDVQFWLTSPAQQILFQKQNVILKFKDQSSSDPTIEVQEAKTYQTMDGFGYTLTGGSAIWINKMDQAERAALLNELFATDGTNIGVSYLRISIGASDLSDHVFTYNDLPAGETDPELKQFSLNPERIDLIPVLKEILAINPKIKILGSPWSAPGWMKTNHDSRGGSLKPEYFEVYARYFVRYIQEMKKEGITIDAITIQNEPLHPGNNPSMYMPAHEQAIFIKKDLGPAFEAAKIKTKIILYDHNADRPDYPMSILADPDAASYVDGSAFHLYGGKIEALSEVHNKFPDKNLYFTEQWVGAPGDLAGDLTWHIRTLIIGASRNWCRNVLEWNLAANPKHEPHTDRGGCDQCLGAITIDGNLVTRNPAYYIIAHASKFVRPGSLRIESNTVDNLPNVAFITPEGKKVLIVLNDFKEPKSFNIKSNGKQITATLDSGAVGTFVW